MPKGYLVAHITYKNRDRFIAEYASKARSVYKEFGGKLLVRNKEVFYREGESADINLIVEFPDKEAVQRFLKSKSYQKIAPGRTENSTGIFIAVEGM